MKTSKPKGRTVQAKLKAAAPFIAQLDRLESLLAELVRDVRHRRVVELNETFAREMRESLMSRESRLEFERRHLARLDQINRGLP